MPRSDAALPAWVTMPHRRLDRQRFASAAIDDAISRGRWQERADLRRAALRNESLLDRIERIGRHRTTADPRTQRHHFRLHHVEVRRPAP